jgi:hypothetical protein
MAAYSHDPGDLTPLMSYNTVPAPNVVSASGEDPPGSMAFAAFQHTTGTYWYSDATPPGWLKFDLGSGNAKIVGKYTVSAADTFIGGENHHPKSWIFQGSNDDTNWTTLDTQTDVAVWTLNEMRTYMFSNSTAYRYYEIVVSTNHGGAAIVIGELELMLAGGATYEGEIADGTGCSDAYEAVLLSGSLTNNVGMSDVCVATVLAGRLTEGANFSDVFEGDTPYVWYLFC